MAKRLSRIRYLKTAATLAFDALREGRLPLSPRRWLLDLRHLRAQMAARPSSAASPPRLPRPDESAALRDAYTASCRTALASFLGAGDELRFEIEDRPKVSVLLVLYNRAEFTLRCLQALREGRSAPIELVVVDNGSTDDTSALLARLHGARVIRPNENIGFLRACNLAAREARGECLLFLNNDTEVRPGTLDAALDTIEGSDSVGAVGGRLVFPDGRLQEAGSIIWNDGSCLGYGRGESPWDPQYSYARDVDYCSAAFLLTRAALFRELGGFDDRYQPAYYEDADYCIRVWKSGRRVVYTPRAVVMHVEFASASSASAAVAMQRERRSTFLDAHREWLAGQVAPSPGAVLRARDRHRTGQRILVVEDRVPHVSAGFGDPRAVALLEALVALGHSVSLYPIAAAHESWERAYDDVPPAVEILLGYGPGRLVTFLRERSGYYDCVIVSRFHNMALMRAKMGAPGEWLRHARVVYDAEAITAVREVGRRRLLGETVSTAAAQRLLDDELALACDVDAVLAVSSDERRQFESIGAGRVHVVSYACEVTPTPRPFRDRDGILFVGAFHELSPNADAVLWFVRNVLTALRERVGEEVRFTIAGQDPPADVRGLRDRGVSIVGTVADLQPLYDQARMFVAPTRFAAGIPLKVIHAAAHGLPVVATSLLARQLEWRDGHELLVADSEQDFVVACASLYQDTAMWERLRRGALTRVSETYSSDVFAAALSGALLTSGGDGGRRLHDRQAPVERSAAQV